MANLYQVLGVARDASSVDIEGAFRERLADLKAAPSPDEDKLALLRDAYHVLANPARRADYDETLQPSRSRGGSSLPPIVATDQDDGPMAEWLASTRLKWIFPLIIVIALAIWWKGRQKPPAPPAPEVVSQAVATSNTENTSSTPAASSTLVSAPPSYNGSAEEVFAGVSGSVARIRVSDGFGNPLSQGSGVVIGPGSVITNCHVTAAGDRISVKVGDDEFPATVALADEERDLCRLNVNGLNAPAVTMASVTSLKVGQRLFAIGAPHGLELTLSEGIVSSLRSTPDGTLIQTTAPISPGSSGGGLFDAGGRLVGIVTFQHRHGQNLNFALPADWIGQMGTRR